MVVGMITATRKTQLLTDNGLIIADGVISCDSLGIIEAFWVPMALKLGPTLRTKKTLGHALTWVQDGISGAHWVDRDTITI